MHAKTSLLSYRDLLERCNVGMCRSRKFCQRGSNSDNIFFLGGGGGGGGVDEGG